MRSLFAWIVLTVIYGPVRCDPGLSFLVALPQTMKNKGVASSLSVMATGQEVNVDINTLDTAPDVIHWSHTLQPGHAFKRNLANESQIPAGSLISDMTLNVTASGPVVLSMVNTAGSNGDAFSPIPVADLGTEYYTLAGARMNPVTASFIAVSAAYDDTEVNVTLPGRESTSEVLVLQGVTYYPHDVITVRLNRLQTLQLQTVMDLTGARVVSSKPVAVLSGQNRTRLSHSGCSSHILDQMPPTRNWAKRFVLIHLPNQTAGEYYRFVAKEPFTVVTVAGGSSEETILKLQHAGDFGEYDLADGQYVYVTSDKPILVAQYTRDQPKHDPTTPAKAHGDPSLMVLSSLEQAKDVYHFSIYKAEHKDMYVVFTVTRTNSSLFKLNGQDLSSRNITWHLVTGENDYVVGDVLLETSDIPCTLGEVGGPKFNAHVFYAANCECWAMSLIHGQPLDTLQQDTCPASASHMAGDGEDNDCDGRIDEEPCCINTDPLDQDSDGYKNEDCASKDEDRCCGSHGEVYACQELQKSSMFTERPNFRRRAETTIAAVKSDTKIACGVTCLSTEGCWGTNFDPKGREGHKCELLLGLGRGLVAADGWGFQSMASVSTFSSP